MGKQHQKIWTIWEHHGTSVIDGGLKSVIISKWGNFPASHIWLTEGNVFCRPFKQEGIWSNQSGLLIILDTIWKSRMTHPNLWDLMEALFAKPARKPPKSPEANAFFRSSQYQSHWNSCNFTQLVEFQDQPSHLSQLFHVHQWAKIGCPKIRKLTTQKSKLSDLLGLNSWPTLQSLVKHPFFVGQIWSNPFGFGE
jgi:hypothetical protein